MSIIYNWSDQWQCFLLDLISFFLCPKHARAIFSYVWTHKTCNWFWVKINLIPKAFSFHDGPPRKSCPKLALLVRGRERAGVRRYRESDYYRFRDIPFRHIFRILLGPNFFNTPYIFSLFYCYSVCSSSSRSNDCKLEYSDRELRYSRPG